MSTVSAKKVFSADTDAATLNFGEELKHAHALLNSEVFLLLDTYEKSRQAASSTVPYSGPNGPLSKVVRHVEAFASPSLRNRELIKEFRRSMIEGYGMAEFEMSQIGNLMPESVEEARQLIPSLAGRVGDIEIQRALDDFNNLCRFQ